MENNEKWTLAAKIDSDIIDYVYFYNSRCDFLKLHNKPFKEYSLFEETKYDYAITPRLLQDILTKNNREERIKKYSSLFNENLIRVKNDDGTISFVFPSGKIIPDNFLLMSQGEGMTCNFAGYKDIEVAVGEGEGSTKFKYETKNVTVYSFVNRFGVRLLDQSKINELEDVVKILKYNPSYVKQLPLHFFTEKNKKIMQNAISEYYDLLLERKSGQHFIYKPYVQRQFELVTVEIESRIRLSKQLKEKREKKLEEEKNKHTYFEKKPTVIKERKIRLNETEKKKLFPSLYEKMEE